MALTFTLDPAVTPDLRDGLLDLWTDVTNSGGPVGFVAPVTREDIRPELVRSLARLAQGHSRLLVGRDDEGGADGAGRVVAAAFLTFNSHRLMTHWLWLYTVMVHPKHQGRGYGRDLLAAAADAARGFEGIESVRLGCRGGEGLEHFYASCGYREVGRVPGAIRVGPGAYRDDIAMLLDLG
ncbi:GNAT family N-acetyltransferase [Streptomyces sp. NPDC046860]|uniref:GNAT family N-acetyltransferase n=1 Tax=Streptomyces sp. NPDC046860 TaxID=3154495 RepID=UPI0033E12F67